MEQWNKPSIRLQPIKIFFSQTVIKELNRLGMIIDLSHSSRKTSRDTMEASEAPVIFSHSSAFALCNSTRNVRDDTLKMVVSITFFWIEWKWKYLTGSKPHETIITASFLVYCFHKTIVIKVLFPKNLFLNKYQEIINTI